MKKIGIVIVTYNRLEKLKIAIEKLKYLEIPDEVQVNVYIVDNNSTNETEQYLKSICNKNRMYHYRKLNENTGGAGGFAYGIKWLCEEERVDYIWGMDDDAYVQPNSLRIIYSDYTEIGKICCMWSNCDEDKDFVNKTKRVERWMFVGFFIPKEIVEVIGYPRADYFIYHDDEEYANRVIKNGYEIYKSQKSIINHKDAVIAGHIIEKKICGITFKLSDLSDWKLYYFVRNALLTYSYKYKEKYRMIFLTFPKYFLYLLILKPKQCGIFLKAYFHGIIGKSGKIVSP